MDAHARLLPLITFIIIVYLYLRRPKPATRLLGGSAWTQMHSRSRDSEFRRTFRVSWDIFHWILEKIEDDIRPKLRAGANAVQPDEQLAMFLHRLATGWNYPSLATHYCKAISTAHSVCDKVRKAILRNLGDQVAHPTPAEAVAMAAAFNSDTKGQLMGAVGAMDGTHIHVRLPHSTLAQSYYHHKYGMSVILHAICDCRYGDSLIILTFAFAANRVDSHRFFSIIFKSVSY